MAERERNSLDLQREVSLSAKFGPRLENFTRITQDLFGHKVDACSLTKKQRTTYVEFLRGVNKVFKEVKASK